MSRLNRALADLPPVFDAGHDPQLVDLLRDNIRLAIRDGLGGEWALGQAVARLLTSQTPDGGLRNGV